MRKATILLWSATLVLAGCKPAAEQARPSNAAAPAETPPSPQVQQPAPANVAVANAPADDRTPLQEPNGPIDPKSVEAAGQVVQSYGALIEQKRWSEANALWGDHASAARFEAEIAAYPDLHLEIGNLGQPEGAAGSIYVTMPVIFYGEAKDGQPFRRSAEVILRRVNDVPGSTEAQRRWHIERVDWAT